MNNGVDCQVPGKCLSESSEPVYKALNPRGITPDVKLTPLSPRCPDLNGKVVYYKMFIEKILKGEPMYGEKYLWPARYLDVPDSSVVQVYPCKYVRVIVMGGETNPFSQAWKFAYPSMVSVDKYR